MDTRTTRYSLTHVLDVDLTHNLHSLNHRERATIADVLAHIAEFETRRLYAPAAHPSMYEYCVTELGYSKGAAFKRIRVARAGRRFPIIFEAIADGRLTLSSVVVLAAKLEICDDPYELITAAIGKTRDEIELMLAERFPERVAQQPTNTISLDLSSARTSESPATVETPGETGAAPVVVPVVAALTKSTQVSPGTLLKPAPRDKLTRIDTECFKMEFVIGVAEHDDFREAQNLLAHQIPSGSFGKVFGRAMKLLVRELQKRKFAATERPRKARASKNPRYIPAHVRRAVRERDGDRCTFVSDAGRRCEARKQLEYDHIEPAARGGRSTVANLRLRCRPHNQLEAERTFGAEYMQHKREEAQREAAAEKAKQDVIPWLRKLGCSLTLAQQAAEHCASMPDAPLEERVRMALRHVGPRAAHSPAPAGP